MDCNLITTIFIIYFGTFALACLAVGVVLVALIQFAESVLR